MEKVGSPLCAFSTRERTRGWGWWEPWVGAGAPALTVKVRGRKEGQQGDQEEGSQLALVLGLGSGQTLPGQSLSHNSGCPHGMLCDFM